MVPGVVVLDCVVRAAESYVGGPITVTGLPHVKFSAPLRPGERAECAFEISATRLDFRVERDGQAIAYGTFALRSPGSAPPEPAGE